MMSTPPSSTTNVPPRPPPPPKPEYRWADTYLSSTQCNSWDILDYLRRSGDAGPFDKLIHSWVKALTALAKADSDATDEERAKATELYARYDALGPDSARAREWYRSASRFTPPPLVVTNTITSSTNCSVNLTLPDPTPAPAPTTHKRRFTAPPTRKKPKKPKKTAPPHAPGLPHRFTTSHASLDTSQKWRLPSGKNCEDILYAHFCNEQTECAAHSWVVDLQDPDVRGLFDDADWDVICGSMPAWPRAEREVVDALMRYEHVGSAGELAAGLEERGGRGGAGVGAGGRWAEELLWHLLPLYENPGLFTNKFNLENWYVVNVWSAFMDRCMMTLPGVHLSRGESISTSSLTRKNTPTSQGHRYDGVLRYHDMEIGAVEHAREWVGTYGRKWGADTRKIVKVLHDMLVAAEIAVGCEEAFRNVVLAGVVTAGLHCQTIRIKYGGGYVCVVSRGQEVRRVPTSLKDAGELFALAAELWGLRMLVQQTIAILEDCEDAKRKRYFQELKDGEKTFVARLPRLRPCIDTDDPDE